jgi:hypothetical protein
MSEYIFDINTWIHGSYSNYIIIYIFQSSSLRFLLNIPSIWRGLCLRGKKTILTSQGWWANSCHPFILFCYLSNCFFCVLCICIYSFWRFQLCRWGEGLQSFVAGVGSSLRFSEIKSCLALQMIHFTKALEDKLNYNFACCCWVLCWCGSSVSFAVEAELHPQDLTPTDDNFMSSRSNPEVYPTQVYRI